MQGEGWTKVISKRSGFKWDVFPFGGRTRGTGLAVETTFFVSEFPDYFNAKRLFELFGCSGRVVEVAVSPRRTRLGKRFAFARFLDVDDGRIMAVRLDNIRIEGKKLHVNLPRFSRDQAVGLGRQVTSNLKGTFKGNSSFVGGEQSNTTGVFRGAVSSYAEVVGKKGKNFESNKEGDAWLNFHSSQELRNRFVRAYVGRVCIPGSAYNLQSYLEMEGIFVIKVTPLGGNCCLLEEIEDGFIDDLIKEGETWWKMWFTSIEKWKEGMVDGNRDVWLRIFGVPIHVWSSEFFVALGEKWGKFLCIDANTAKGEAFDVARILINIPIAVSIPDSVSVCIDGSVFRLCIREDAQGMFRSVGGIQKGPSSDGSSSSCESDRIALSDSDNSVNSEDRDIANTASKDPSVVKSAALIQSDNSEDACKEGSKRSFSGSFGCDPEGNSSHTVDAICKNISGDLNDVKEVCCNSNSESEDLSIDAFSEGHNSSFKGLSVMANKIVHCLHTSSEGSEATAVKASTHSGKAASELNLEPVLERDSRECSARSSESVGERGKGAGNGGSDIQVCSADSIEPSGSISFSRHLNHAGPGSEDVRKLDLEDIVMSNRIGIYAGTCSIDSILVKSNSVVAPTGNLSAGGIKGADDRGLSLVSGPVLPIQPMVNGLDITVQKTKHWDGKKIKRANVNSGGTLLGKGRQFAKSRAVKSFEGTSSFINSDGRCNSFNGSFSNCYGEQSEESDIRRNNDRHWEFLKRDVGERLWEAMFALGVVDTEGRKASTLGDESGCGGRKVVKKIVQ